MSRRTHQQALAWRDAALAHLASIPLRAWANDESARGQIAGNRASQEVKISAGKATLTIYLTGSVAIGGPAGDADLLAESLDQHGFIDGWYPGSCGRGVVWVPRSETAASPLAEAQETLAAAKKALARRDEEADRLLESVDRGLNRVEERRDLSIDTREVLGDLRNLVALALGRPTRKD